MSENEDRQETDPRMASSTGDPPLRRKKEDRLNRARFAEALAGQIASAPGSGGVVFGLLGPYGSGKTSILDAFAKLPAAAETLTTTSAGSGMGRSSDDAKAEIEEFEKAGGEHVQVIREARRHLFPASSWIENAHHGGDWLKTCSKVRRVAHPRVLRFHLEKNLPEDVMPDSAVQDLFESLGDRDALAMRFAAMDSRMLEHAVERLREYEEDYRPEHVEPAVEVLLNQMPRLREGTEQFMDVGAHRKVRWAVLDFLRKIEDPEALSLKVKMVMPRVDNLSARLDLAMMVGHREGTPHPSAQRSCSSSLSQPISPPVPRSRPRPSAARLLSLATA